MARQVRRRHADGVLRRGEQVAQFAKPAAVPAAPVDDDDAGLGCGARGLYFPAPLDDVRLIGAARGAYGRVRGRGRPSPGVSTRHFVRLMYLGV